MAVRIEPHAEPIPGYRLIERLGGGGFGEVWKAEAPGGLYKAVKFVYGDLQAADSDDASRAEQELRALSRVKTVRHPYILSMERLDIIDGQLIIVMELADRTLWDRFKECRKEGLPGIPRDELLQYMAEAAEGLDLMNIHFQLQHLDIKPQNLFLVFNHVKIADFGLVKDLGGKGAATITGGVTPVYAAPETFDGYLSQHSDQYSLAIVYQELLCGQRPFAGSTMRQLVFQHLQGTPDLTPLPETDRPVVARALAKSSDDRFPTCLDFINALRRGLNPSVAPAATAVRPATFSTEGLSDGGPSYLDFTLPKEEVARQLGGDEEDSKAHAPTYAIRPGARTKPDAPPTLHDEPAPAAPPTAPPPRPESAPRAPVASAPHEFNGIVQPALVVGLGRMGMDTLLHLRRFITQRYGQAAMLPQVRAVAIDTDAEAIHKAGQQDPRWALRAHELVHAKLNRPSYYIRRDGTLPTNDWVSSKVIYRISNKQMNQAGLRVLGRLAFVDNYRLIAKRLEMELQACCSEETLHAMQESADVGVRSAIPRVYVVTSLAGATGSGMFLDVAYVVRHLLRQQGFERAEVVGLFYLPPVQREGIRSAPLAHAHASLTELSHFSRKETEFKAEYDPFDTQRKPTNLIESGPPFDRCFFLTLPLTGLSDELPETVQLAGEFLFRELATPMGKTLDEARKNWQSITSLRGTYSGPQFQTFGLFRFLWPRRELLTKTSHSLGKRLVARWMSKDSRPFVERMKAWALPLFEEIGLRADALVERVQQACLNENSEAPELIFQRIVHPLAQDLIPPPGVDENPPPVRLNIEPARRAFLDLEQFLGVPEECLKIPPNQYVPTPFEYRLREVSDAILDEIDRRVTKAVVRMLEDPEYRLAGAEEALRQFSRVVEETLKSQEHLAKELNHRASELYESITSDLHNPPEFLPVPPAPRGGFGRSKKSAPPPSGFGVDLYEHLRAYPKARYQSLILSHVCRIYISLRGHLSDQLREVGYCRQRLAELMGLLEEKPEIDLLSASNQKMMLPPGCKRIEEASLSIERGIAADELIDFDREVQKLIKKNYRALLEVCMGSSSAVRNLAPQLIDEGTRFLESRLEIMTTAQILLAKYDAEPDDSGLDRELRDAFTIAAPTSGRAHPDKEISILSVFADEAGRTIAERVKQLLPEIRTVFSDRPEELVFFREFEKISLRDLEQLGPIAREAYHQRCGSDPTLLHTREDVGEWRPVEVS
jgi:serine/threonine protein kinase